MDRELMEERRKLNATITRPTTVSLHGALSRLSMESLARSCVVGTVNGSSYHHHYQPQLLPCLQSVTVRPVLTQLPFFLVNCRRPGCGWPLLRYARANDLHGTLLAHKNNTASSICDDNVCYQMWATSVFFARADSNKSWQKCRASVCILINYWFYLLWRGMQHWINFVSLSSASIFCPHMQ